MTRRDLLRMTLTGGAAAAVGLGAGAARAVEARGDITPQDALRMLQEGNARYVANTMLSFEEDLELIRRDNEESQSPFASILSCADSRVPPEIVFDQTIGRVFVTRVAGNIATPEIIASLEYGSIVLGAKVIVVLGHASCGAVSAAIGGKAVPGQISALYAPLRPAVAISGPNLDATIRTNAKIQATILRDASPVLSDLVKHGELLVVAGFYELASGRVTIL
jgi:carbonic anhydrase